MVPIDAGLSYVPITIENPKNCQRNKKKLPPSSETSLF